MTRHYPGARMVSTGANPIYGNERRVRSYCALVGYSLSRQTCGPGWLLKRNASGQRVRVLYIASMNARTSTTYGAGSVPRRPRLTVLACDFVSAEAGITKLAQTIPGHRYQVEAWGKHVRSQSPVELSLGVDLSGAENWQAESVTWYP